MVNWTYMVTNTGNVALGSVTVTDDQGEDVSCPKNTLSVGETMTCTASGIATAGQYGNVGTVTGTPPVGSNVTSNDPSHYFGVQPSVVIKKFTNGHDADEQPGLFVPVGSAVTWTYIVTNTGNVPLTDVAVTDNVAGVTPLFVSGDTNNNSVLDVGEVWIYEATGIAIVGQYGNIGTVIGTTPTGDKPTDEDPSHYFGSNPAIRITKYTNGEDADTPVGPTLVVGSDVTWTYVVTNTGNVPLSNVTVTDNVAGVTPIYVSGDANNNGLLDVNEVWLFSASGIAVAGQYVNIGTVTGTPPVGPNVTDSNPSHYFGDVDTDPTGLPDSEQPQANRFMFLPTIHTQD
jgi:uncharacterized repeat protein (TIGR01451 family)